MRNLIFILLFVFLSIPTLADGYDVFGFGFYDIKFNGNASNKATDFRYERRFDNALFDIGPEEDNFFYLKPFVGIETTSKSASYFEYKKRLWKFRIEFVSSLDEDNIRSGCVF